MIDATLRRFLDPVLEPLAERLSKTGVRANAITLAGFAVGMLAVPLLALQHWWLGLLAIALNRLADGLDGAVARRTRVSDLGAYLDIVLDFMVYAGVVFGFCLAEPANSIYGAFLLFSFFASGSTFLGYAILAARRNITTEIRGKKSIYYLGGLTEGFETILAFALMCVFPGAFPAIAVVFGVLCWITGATRIGWAWRTLKDPAGVP